MNQATIELGYKPDEDFRRSLLGSNWDRVEREYKRFYGPEIDTKKLFARSFELNEQIMRQGVPLMKGARELLDYLHQANIHTCIGTTTNRKNTMVMLEADNLLDDFEDIVCGDEVEHGKPAPDIYLKCLSKFKDIDKSEVLIFEDGEAGGRAALGSGARLVLVPDIARLSEDIQMKAFKVIEDLSKIIDVIKEENEGTASV